MELISVWAAFALLAATILVAGYYLSVYGDIIAEETGLGGSVVGLVLVATVTSLPELVTGISAVTFTDLPDLAVSGVLGSCTFNLLILVVIDIFYRKECVYQISSSTHLKAGMFGIVLIGLSAVALAAPSTAAVTIGVPIGLHSVVILIFYLWAMKKIYDHEQLISSEADAGEPKSVAKEEGEVSLKKAVVIYLIASSFVVGAGIGLPFVGERITALMGWNEAFVGTMFIAFATSLPELAVTFSSIKIGAIDMAIGNVLGSNMFNILAIFFYDAIYTKAAILSSISANNLFTAVASIVMTVIVIIGVKSKAGRIGGAISWVSMALILAYLVNAFLIF